eukprot:scaffold3388_cov105-Isochrysis_galbana.AAC.4
MSHVKARGGWRWREGGRARASSRRPAGKKALHTSGDSAGHLSPLPPPFAGGWIQSCVHYNNLEKSNESLGIVLCSTLCPHGPRLPFERTMGEFSSSKFRRNVGGPVRNIEINFPTGENETLAGFKPQTTQTDNRQHKSHPLASPSP